MPQLQTPNELTPLLISNLIKLVGAAGGIIVALVAALYSMLRNTDTKQQNQLDAGQDEFTEHLVEIEKIKKDVEVLNKTITEIEVKQVQDHESVLAIKIHHKHNHGEEIK